MADPSSTYLTGATLSRGLKFRSNNALCSFLGISEPYSRCTAYAPRARKTSYCTRPVNRDNQAKVSDLLAKLVNVNIISFQSARLLKALSACVVCGVTRWHQTKVDDVYESWIRKLWGDYLSLNHLDPRQCDWVPCRLAEAEWERSLRVVRAEQGYDLEGYSDDSWGDQNIIPEAPGRNDTLEDVSTPDPNHSDIVDGSPDHATLLDDIEILQSRLASSAASQRLSRVTFSVYRDPAPHPESHLRSIREAGPSSQPLTSSGVGTSRALTSLDPNIPVRHGTRTRVHTTNPEGTGSRLSNTAGPSGVGGLADDQEECYENQNPLHDQPASISAGPAALEAEVIEATDRSDENAETGDEGDQDLDATSQSNSDDVQEDQFSHEPDTVDSSQPRGNQAEDQEPSIIVVRGNGQTDELSISNAARREDDLLAGPVSLLEPTNANDDDGSDTNADVQLALSPQPSALTPHTPFRPYPQLAPLHLLKTLFIQLTQTVSQRRLGPGYIYAYTRTTAPGLLKIGYTKEGSQPPPPRRPRRHPVDERLAWWAAACGEPVQEVFRVRVPSAVARIEGLVHTVLRPWRRVEDPPCERCASRPGHSGMHKEWFEVDEATARTVVGMWGRFSEQQPYDEFGRLGDFWSERVGRDKDGVRDGDTVRTWLDGMPRMVEEARRESEARREEEARSGKSRNIIGPFEGLYLSCVFLFLVCGVQLSSLMVGD